jgi:hypothetical protein
MDILAGAPEGPHQGQASRSVRPISRVPQNGNSRHYTNPTTSRATVYTRKALQGLRFREVDPLGRRVDYLRGRTRSTRPTDLQEVAPRRNVDRERFLLRSDFRMSASQ